MPPSCCHRRTGYVGEVGGGECWGPHHAESPPMTLQLLRVHPTGRCREGAGKRESDGGGGHYKQLWESRSYFILTACLCCEEMAVAASGKGSIGGSLHTAHLPNPGSSENIPAVPTFPVAPLSLFPLSFLLVPRDAVHVSPPPFPRLCPSRRLGS